MNFNFIVFPNPTPNYLQIKYKKKNLIFIPKDKDQTNHIPCYLVRYRNSPHPNNFVIFFHGNAEDAFSSINMAENLGEELKMNVVIVEYPGYSIYSEYKSDVTILQDTTIVYDYIKNTFNLEDKNMYVFGRSLGNSPAIYLASKRRPAGLFIVSGFTSLKAVVKNKVGFLSFMVYERFKSIEYIKEVECPVKFIHGIADPLIPWEETSKLFEACKSIKDVTMPTHMTHNDFDLLNDIVIPIADFARDKCNIETREIIEFNDNLFIVPKKYEKLLKRYT